MSQLSLGVVSAGTKRRFAVVALPVTTAAAAAAPAPTPPFALLAFAEGAAFLAGLRLAKSVFFWRARIVILVWHRMFSDGLLRELLHAFTRLTATTTATAPSPTSSATFAFTDFNALLAFHFRCGGLLDGNVREFFFNFLDGRELRLLRSEIARGFRRVHLLAAIDHVRLLPCHGGISRDGDRYTEALLQGAQMRTLVVEHI